MLLSIGIIVCLAFCSVALCKLALFLDSKEQENRFRLKVIRESYEQQQAAEKRNAQSFLGDTLPEKSKLLS